MAPDERLISAVESMRSRPECNTAKQILAALHAEDEWTDVTESQVRRALTAAIRPGQF